MGPGAPVQRPTFQSLQHSFVERHWSDYWKKLFPQPTVGIGGSPTVSWQYTYIRVQRDLTEDHFHRGLLPDGQWRLTGIFKGQLAVNLSSGVRVFVPLGKPHAHYAKLLSRWRNASSLHKGHESKPHWGGVRERESARARVMVMMKTNIHSALLIHSPFLHNDDKYSVMWWVALSWRTNIWHNTTTTLVRV